MGLEDWLTLSSPGAPVSRHQFDTEVIKEVIDKQVIDIGVRTTRCFSRAS